MQLSKQSNGAPPGAMTRSRFVQQMRYVRSMAASASLGLGLLATPGALPAQALSQPDGWEVRAERFVAMPPGFHITTSPSVLLFHPDARAEGVFEVRTDGFLFRGDSPNGYGLFVGGRDLDGDDAAWVSFEIAHDGTWVVRQRAYRGREQGFAVVDVLGPEPGPVALPGEEQTARNALAVVVGSDQVEFRVNDETVVTLPRDELELDGVTGFRVGAGLNLHLISLSVTAGGETTEWAPAPPPESEEGGA